MAVAVDTGVVVEHAVAGAGEPGGGKAFEALCISARRSKQGCLQGIVVGTTGQGQLPKIRAKS